MYHTIVYTDRRVFTTEAFRQAAGKVVAGLTDDRRLDRDLAESVRQRLADVADAVAAVRPLAELSGPERRECAKTSAVKRYAAGTVVYDDERDSGEADAHFVLEGRCVCVQRLRVRKTTAASGRDRYVMVRTANDRGGSSRTVYVKVSDLRPGSAFGLGERLEGRVVLAVTSDVKCLLVPSAFLAKHNPANVWGRTACYLDGRDPTAEQSFRKFVADDRWEEYKTSLADRVFRRR